MRQFILLLSFAVAVFAGGARNDSWTVIGPGGGGAQFMPTLSPHDAKVTLVGCDMTGAYLTRDGGQSWRMINLRGTPRFFVFDPVNPRVMYASTIALWRTEDGGTTWKLVHPAPDSVTGITKADDHAGEEILSRDGADRVRALAVDPADSKTLYALMAAPGRRQAVEAHKVSLAVSRDFGASWRTLQADVPAGAHRVYVDPASPAGNRTVYLIGAEGVTEVAAGKLTTRPAPEKLTDVSAGFSQGGKMVVYGVSGTALLVSTDRGATWNVQKPARRLVAVATSIAHPETAYASYAGLMEGGAAYHGVFKTTDSGATWTPVWKESREKSPTVDDGWLSDRFGTDWGENPINLGVSPIDPALAYGTDFGRSLRTTDGGRTWRAAYSKKLGDGWTTTGLDVTTNYGIHFDPFDPQHVFISYTDIGLFASRDGGRSWLSATANGVPRRWINTTYWMEFDPEVKGRLWAVMSGVHDLPRPKMWRRTGTSRYSGGVVRSDDGGATWKPMTNGLPETAATHILLDRRSTAQARVLYVTGFARGVYKSSDGGASWALKNNGLPAEPFAWRLTQDADGTLYLVLARRSEGATIRTPGDGALYRSRDGAESWEKMTLPAGVNGPVGLLAQGKRLVMAAWAREENNREVDGGIYVSADAGATWKRTLHRDQHVYDVTADPKNPRLLYACGFESSAWRSEDAGEHWTRIRGYNFKWGHRVMVDPRDPGRIFVLTFGGSVWHGPAKGDAKAVEDIVTPVVSYGR